MLSRMEYPAMPLPFGVLRAVDKPSYTEMMLDQVDAAINTKGAGDLKSLFNTGDTWIVE
jgi:2-oxoglutarate ferredoxin oxidoreductase subunit beta